jgi:ABC-type nitrate/sulfonate/bicarbonate transport system substrate-binding protein
MSRRSARTASNSGSLSLPAHVDRRQVLRGGLFGAAALVAAPILSACGSSSKAAAGSSTTPAAGGSSSSAPASYGTLDYRLSWIKNVEFAGAYIADSKGYYTAAGFSKVNLIAGGPTATPMEADIQTGKALVAVSSPDITGAAVVKGADIKIIGAGYQKNPFAMMSMTKNPIKTPQDMIGKKIGVQAANESVWEAFLKANDLSSAKITKVPVQFDPLPLTTGVVDGWFSFITNEPNDLRSKGFDVTTFLLADYKYPLVSEVYITKGSTITSKPDLLKAFLVAEIKGWKDAIADPAAAAALTVNTYGKGNGLVVAEQTLEAKDQNALVESADTKTNGIFTITQALIDENIATLKFAGVNITADKLFDMSLLTAVYKEHPELI